MGTASRRWSVLLLLGATAAMLLVAAGCPQQPEDVVMPPDDILDPLAMEPTGEPIRIGGLFAITGPASSLGEPERDTAVMLQEQINAEGGIDGRPLEIIIRDTRGDETEGITAARELIDRERVVAIVGPSTSGVTLGIIDTMEQAEIPLLSCAAARKITDPTKKWVFGTPQSDEDAVARIFEYLNSVGISRVATITASSGFGIAGLEQLELQAEGAGITLVTNEEFADTDNDMTPQLTKIKGTDPEAVICWGIGPAPALIARNMRQLDMQVPLIMSHGVANRRFIEGAGEAAEGIILPAGKLLVADQLPDEDRQKQVLLDYAASFEEKFGKPADTFGGHAWDAIMLVVNAIREHGAEPDQIREGIENTEDFVGIGGIFNFGPDRHYGLSPEAFVMIEIRDGDWTLLDY